MKKIAILGGTFDPIHNGHIIILQTLKDTQNFDEIWLMPAGHQPFKEVSSDSRLHRLAMCHLVSKQLPYVKVSSYEIDHVGPSYTYNTLLALTELHMDTEFFWVIGYDNLRSVVHWKQHEELLQRFGFILVNRGGFSDIESESLLTEIETGYKTSFIRVEIPSIELSSTLLRERVREGRSLVGYTLDSVAEYISTYCLYEKN